jgi:putative colanic acid biosynthesis acetyltransferase WcaF
MAPITLGERCVISQRAHLCAGSHDIDSANFQLITAPIELKPRVWICAEAFIGLGVSIAEGCVIGARAVVTRDVVEAWTVWTGNPASRRRAREHQGSAS